MISAIRRRTTLQLRAGEVLDQDEEQPADREADDEQERDEVARLEPLPAAAGPLLEERVPVRRGVPC